MRVSPGPSAALLIALPVAGSLLGVAICVVLAERLLRRPWV